MQVMRMMGGSQVERRRGFFLLGGARWKMFQRCRSVVFSRWRINLVDYHLAWREMLVTIEFKGHFQWNAREMTRQNQSRPLLLKGCSITTTDEPVHFASVFNREEMRRQGLYRAQGGIGLPTRFVSDLFPVYGTLFVPFIAKKRSLTTPIGKKGKKDGHFGQKDCQECWKCQKKKILFKYHQKKALVELSRITLLRCHESKRVKNPKPLPFWPSFFTRDVWPHTGVKPPGYCTMYKYK